MLRAQLFPHVVVGFSRVIYLLLLGFVETKSVRLTTLPRSHA